MNRSGHECEVWFDPVTTGRTAKFWTVGVEALLARESAEDLHLVLFGLTFNDRNTASCLSALRSLEDLYASVTVWTHRYPDGYGQGGLTIRIPPDDLIYNDPSHPLLSRLGRHLDGHDKVLLTSALLAAKAIPASSFPEEDELALRVAKSLDHDVDQTWEALTSGRADSLPTIDRAENDAVLASLINVDKAYQKSTNTVEATIGKDGSNQVAHALTAYARLNAVPPGAVLICWVRNADSGVHDRVILKRHDEDHAFPSLRWLVENRFGQQVPRPLRGRHFGPQDVLYFSVPEDESRASLAYDLEKVAIELARSESGGRHLTAALTRDVASVGNEILQSIDLTGTYTTPDQPLIRIDEASIYVLLHRSSRTNSRRATLTVPIEAKGADAVAFLFRENGYNLLKIERALEGALTGLRMRGLTWLQPQGATAIDTHLPKRVRLDVRPTPGAEGSGRFAERVRRGLDRDRMSTIDKSQGDVADDSVIGRVLVKAELNKLVCYNETETIGPSVAHALALLSTATVAGEWVRRGARQGDRGSRMRVLDLFSGSGIANRLLTQEGHTVTSVDKFVPASAVGLDSGRDGLWLKADARDVLNETNPILDQRFDLIGLDPPHAELMDVLFSGTTRSLVSACAKRSDLLVLYQGHSTQSGRLALLRAGLQNAGFPNVAVLQVEEELIVLAATRRLIGDFIRFVETVMEELRVIINRWGFDRMVVRSIGLGEDSDQPAI
ncbi:hypothetical protein [Phycicoccus avicenniae]|uniref:hypothetical protein n=1 Tax=Phycicoccus avicenniae TaxID=2828860 RepID=UPI003D2CD8C6